MAGRLKEREWGRGDRQLGKKKKLPAHSCKSHQAWGTRAVGRGSQSPAPGGGPARGEAAARSRPRLSHALTHTHTGIHVCPCIYSPQSPGPPLCSGRRFPGLGGGYRGGWEGGGPGWGGAGCWMAICSPRGPTAPGSSGMRSLEAAFGCRNPSCW